MVLRSRVQYDCLEVKDFVIPNAPTTSDAARSLTGFTMNNGNVFCVKRSNYADESVIYRIDDFVNEINKPEPVIRKKEIPYGSRGLAYHNKYLYVATGSDIVARVPVSMTNTQVQEVKVKPLGDVVFNSRAITKKADGRFILMGNSLNVGTETLCFAEFIFDAEALTLTEEAGTRFYVKNTGYTEIRDCHYNEKYGLFIVTNRKDGSNYTTNCVVMRVGIKKDTDDSYEGCKLYYPVAEYIFDGDPDKYVQLSIGSVYINPEDSKMYVATNAVLGGTSNTADDSIWHVGNLRFYNDSAFYAKLYTEKSVSIPTLSVEVDGGSVDCHNPGAFALDDNDKGYCVSSYTIKDMPNRDLVSIFLKSDDINNSDFYRSNKDKVYSNLGHANGMAYYDNALYVAAYRRDNDPSKVRKNIVKLSMAGEELAVYTTEVFIGGISHYKGNQFILVDYNDTRAATHYSKTPKFYIGYFDDTTHSFKIVKTFSVKNPTFIEGDSALQDIHYDAAFGLYFVALSDTDYMYRVLPENVEKAANTGEVINPDEKYVFGGMGELETFYISQSGKMYAVDGGTTDALDVITTLGFYK